MFKLLSRYPRSQRRQLHLFNRTIPDHIIVPPYVSNLPDQIPSEPVCQTSDQIKAIKFACTKVRDLFQALDHVIKPGLCTQDIDDFVFDYCMTNSVYPSPLGYHGFPKSVCTSVNEVVCHGIPSQTQILQPGDLLSVDVSIYTGHAHGDACRSYALGDLDQHTDVKHRIELARSLCTVAHQCCQAGIDACAPDRPFTVIAQAISETARRHGCRVVVGVHGHGIGWFLHGPPDIIHSTQEKHGNNKGSMKPGHVFTIEPCISLPHGNSSSSSSSNRLWPFSQTLAMPLVLQDGWTVITRDKALTAQFEQTIMISEQGSVILT